MMLDKEAVAVRQLDTAIRLLFIGEDAVSVHTLACAAADIFRDLLKSKTGDTWRDAMIASYPSTEKTIHQILVQAQNFVKHANRDPEKEFDFDVKTNDDAIIMATLEYGDLLLVCPQDEPRSRFLCPFFNFGILRYIPKSPEGRHQ